MANKLYGSIGGLSDNVTKIYVPVNGLSDNIVKGYCSVGGLSKLFFGSGGLYPSLKFAYNYQKNNTYPVYRASIRDTVKYMLKKTIYISMHSSASLLLGVLETKIDEILNYVDNAASGCNQCSCGIQDISNTSVTMNILLGNSQLSEVTISSAYENYKYYPIYYISGKAEKASTFCQIVVKLDGTITKTTRTTTSSLNNFIGQMVSWNSSYPTIAYIDRVSNLGVRIQQIYTSSPLADWDFTVSSIDKIDNLSAQSDSFGSLIVPIYSDGIHLTQIYSGLNVAPWMLKYCNAFEIEIGNVNDVTQYGTYLMNSSEFYLSYSSTDNKWFFGEHSLNLTEDIGVTDKTFFANSVIKITFDSEDYPSLYKDNTLIYKCNVVRLQRDKVYGDVLSLLYGYACSISSLKFYIETRPISVVPEYDYVAGQNYSIHNPLSLEETLDYLFDKWRSIAISEGWTTYSHANNFITNWVNIKQGVLDAIENAGISLTTFNAYNAYIAVEFSSGTSTSRTNLQVHLGSKAFPMGIRVDSTGSNYNQNYGLFDTNISRVNFTYALNAWSYEDNTYDIGTIFNDPSPYNNMGYYDVGNSTQNRLYLSSFGVKLI